MLKLFSVETSVLINLDEETSSKIPVGELPALFKTILSLPGTLEEEFRVCRNLSYIVVYVILWVN